MFIDHLRKDLLHFTGVDLPIHMNIRHSRDVLISDVEHSQFAPSLRRLMNKIPRPDTLSVLALVRKAGGYALSTALGIFCRQPNLIPGAASERYAAPTRKTACFISRVIFAYPNSGCSLDLRRKATFNFAPQASSSFALYA